MGGLWASFNRGIFLWELFLLTAAWLKAAVENGFCEAVAGGLADDRLFTGIGCWCSRIRVV